MTNQPFGLISKGVIVTADGVKTERRTRTQRNKIVTVFTAMQGTLTATLVALVSAGAIDPVHGLLLKGALEVVTTGINVWWPK